VVIHDAGIRDSVLLVGVIGWNEVRSASVESIGSVQVVALQLRDPEHFIRRLPGARQFIAPRMCAHHLASVVVTRSALHKSWTMLLDDVGEEGRVSGTP